MWAIVAWRLPAWRPRTAAWPLVILPLAAFALAVVASPFPRLGVEYLAWGILLVALYLLLVRILATLLRSDAGSASVAGHDVRSGAEQGPQALSLTGQFAAVDDGTTGRETLAFVARRRHRPDA